jgi:hypothetical protein
LTARLHKPVNYFALQHKSGAALEKDFAGELLVPYYFIERAEFVRFDKESQNGLEDTKDR